MRIKGTQIEDVNSAPQHAKATRLSPSRVEIMPRLPSLPYTIAGLLVVRALSARLNIIHDADETFNYWEPLHFLLHNTGFQTWEYSPVYAIRSWTYILVHALPLLPNKLSSLAGTALITREQEFYVVRVLLGSFSACVEGYFVHVIQDVLGPGIAWMTISGLLGSTGMFNASTALLPSSFAMYFTTLGLAFSLHKRSLAATVTFGIGVVLGWPFVFLLFIPILLLSLWEGIGNAAFPYLTYIRGGLISAQILLLGVVVDYYFYRKCTIVPLNIVLYNVFSARDGRGPGLFGVESASYYFKNLLLNFNILFPVSLLAVPLSIVLKRPVHFRASCGYLLWLAVFTAQAHKEERFMYPIYPALTLSSAIAIELSFRLAEPLTKRMSSIVHRPDVLQTTLKISFLLLSSSLSLFRIWSMVTSYSAPLHFFPNLSPGTYCMGNDWYRFPTSFLLPDNVRIQFMKSEFGGLLPGRFNESWSIPAGMNDRNEFSPDKVIPESACECVIYWSPIPGNLATPFVDRETGTRKPGYYSYKCSTSNADRLNRLGEDLFGRKLDADGKRYSEGALEGAIQRP